MTARPPDSAPDNPEKTATPDRRGTPAQTNQPEKSAQPDRPGLPARSGQPDQTDQPDQPTQAGRPGPAGQRHSPASPDWRDRPARLIQPSQPDQPDANRRLLLRAIPALLVTIGAGLWGLLPARAKAAFAGRFPTRTVEDDAPRFDPASGMVRVGGRRAPYVLVIDGLVERPVRLGYAELRALPQVRRTADFHCVEGWSVEAAPWGGVDFPTLFSRVRPLPGARFVHFHALGRTQNAGGLTHYVESFPLADLVNPALGALLALDLDGRPLTDERGAPARVVSPFDLAYKSIKFVTRVEFAAAPADGWWTRANPIYPSAAPVPAGRLRTPDPRTRRGVRP